MPALVSTGWLAAQVHAPDLVVVDASVDKIATPGGGYTWDAARSAFERDGHVAGARFADLVRDFSEPDASFPFTKPRIDRMASAVGALGNLERDSDCPLRSREWVWPRGYGGCSELSGMMAPPFSMAV
jgi:3-mercaptopyruvate sulfurtransferase SseA